MSKLLYPALFYPEDLGYSVIVPDIEGCVTQGDSLEEALSMAVDAVGLCLEDFAARNESPPVPSKPESMQTEAGAFVSLIPFDPVSYRRKHDSKAVKKTLTIPSWLNTLANEQHVNFSGVLQEALIQQLGITVD